MARLQLVILTALGTLSGCVYETLDAFFPEPSLPVHVRVQDTWSTEPNIGWDGVVRMSAREIIVDAIMHWNDAVASRLRPEQPSPFVFDGFVSMQDFDQHDPTAPLSDDQVIIYKLTETTPDLRDMLDAGGYPACVVGYGLPNSDVLVMLDAFDPFLRDKPYGGQPDSRIELLRQTVAHELGHVLGVQHYRDRVGLMNDLIEWYTTDEHGRYVRQTDVEAFCLVHPNTCQ